jgi:DNA polymerase-3 subunit delta
MEGNLLACAQEIDKLAMLFGAPKYESDDIEGNLCDNARYNVLRWPTPAARRAGGGRAILDSLRGEGVEPILILCAARGT